MITALKVRSKTCLPRIVGPQARSKQYYRIATRVENKALALAGQNEILISHLYNFIQILGRYHRKLHGKQQSGQPLLSVLSCSSDSRLAK